MSWAVVRDLWANDWVRGGVALLAGAFVAVAVGSLLNRRLRRAGMPHRAMVFSKIVTYVGVLLAIVMAASAAGIEIDKVLATAGVLTIAVGLAAQTSLSNVIAGLFLLLDRPFQVGDSVEIEGRGGTIERISLLSTYLRTWDNLLVRWPNEVVMKATILNYVGYPARRVDTKVGIAYGSDIAEARRVINDAVGALPNVLLDPAPQVLAIQFLDSSIEIQARVWVPRVDFLEARSQIVQAIHDALGEAGIEIPFPQRTVWHRTPRPDDDADGEGVEQPA